MEACLIPSTPRIFTHGRHGRTQDRHCLLCKVIAHRRHRASCHLRLKQSEIMAPKWLKLSHAVALALGASMLTACMGNAAVTTRPRDLLPDGPSHRFRPASFSLLMTVAYARIESKNVCRYATEARLQALAGFVLCCLAAAEQSASRQSGR